MLWAKNLDYYVILAKRKGYWLLRSAYFIKFEKKKVKLQNAYNKYGPYKTGVAN